MSILPVAALLFGLVVSAIPAQGLVVRPWVPIVPPAGDADGDGINDTIVRTTATWEVVGSRTSQPIPYLSRPVQGCGSETYAFLGDVNADGHDDLGHYCVPVSSAQCQVVSGSDGSNLSTRQGLLHGALDFDADGTMDLLHMEVINANGDYVDSVRSGRTGSVLFQVSGTIYSISTWDSLQLVGDADGDGCDDLGIYTDMYSPGTFSFWPSLRLVPGPSGAPIRLIGSYGRALGDWNGNGTGVFFSSGASFGPLQPQFIDWMGNPVWQPPAGTQLCEASGDLDGDGRADVVAKVNGVYSYLSGATQAVMAGSVNVNSRAVGDLDGDGRDEAVTTPAAQVYEWVDPARPVAARAKTRGGSGTTSTGRKPRIKTRGHCGLGHTIFFDVRGAMAGGVTFMLFGNGADTDLAPLGAPGNRGYVTPQAALFIATDARGIARYQLTVPNAATLLGARLSAQSAVFDPPSNLLGLVTSNAIDMEVH